MDLRTTFDSETLACDWTLSGPSLAEDGGLGTALAISLFTDARAPADAVLPDGGTDRRGWWGDIAAPDAASRTRPWATGSLLWLLSREKQTAETARRARDYARQALAWISDMGIADGVEVSAAWNGLGVLDLQVGLAMPGGPIQTYSFLWSAK